MLGAPTRRPVDSLYEVMTRRDNRKTRFEILHAACFVFIAIVGIFVALNFVNIFFGERTHIDGCTVTAMNVLSDEDGSTPVVSSTCGSYATMGFNDVWTSIEVGKTYNFEVTKPFVSFSPGILHGTQAWQ